MHAFDTWRATAWFDVHAKNRLMKNIQFAIFGSSPPHWRIDKNKMTSFFLCDIPQYFSCTTADTCDFFNSNKAQAATENEMTVRDQDTWRFDSQLDKHEDGITSSLPHEIMQPSNNIFLIFFIFDALSWHSFQFFIGKHFWHTQGTLKKVNRLH